MQLARIGREVDRIDRQRRMQLARSARGIDSVPVVYAVGNIRCLLYLYYLDACTQCVDDARRDEEYVAGAYFDAVEQLGQRRLGYGFDILLARDFGILEADVQCRTGLAVDNIPHLGLARRVVPLGGQSVVGVHLHR